MTDNNNHESSSTHRVSDTNLSNKHNPFHILWRVNRETVEKLDIVDGFDVVSVPLHHFTGRGDAEVKALIMSTTNAKLEDVLPQLNSHATSPHFFIPQATAAEIQNMMPNAFDHIEFSYPNQVPILQFVSPDKSADAFDRSNFADFNKEPGCEDNLNACTITTCFQSKKGLDSAGWFDWFGYGNYSEAQEDAGIALTKYLVEKYEINPVNVFASSTITRNILQSPGDNFPWQKLHDAGFGYIPTPKILGDGYSMDELIEIAIEKLTAIGFNGLSEDGQWNVDATQSLAAFILQYDQQSWKDDGSNLTETVLESLNGFEPGIFHNNMDDAVTAAA